MHQSAFSAIELWSSIRHPSIVPVQEAFTTKAFNDNCTSPSDCVVPCPNHLHSFQPCSYPTLTSQTPKPSMTSILNLSTAPLPHHLHPPCLLLQEDVRGDLVTLQVKWNHRIRLFQNVPCGRISSKSQVPSKKFTRRVILFA